MVKDQGRPGAGVLDPARAADDAQPAPYRPASLYEAVVALYARYTAAAARDVGAWPELFTGDCVYQILSAENTQGEEEVQDGPLQPLLICEGHGMVCDRAKAYLVAQVQRKQTLRYLVSGIVIVTADERWLTVRADFEATRTLDNERPEVIFTGEYRDRIARRASGLLFRDKTCIYDGRIVPTALAAPL